MGWFGPDVKKLQAAGDVEGLIRALGNWSGGVRSAAAGALEEIGDARAVEPLIKVLGDNNKYVFRAAAGALGEIGDARAVEPLFEAVGTIWFYEIAAEALGKIGEPAVESLIKALGDENQWVREAVVRALGETSDTRAVEPLIKALEDDRVCKAAAEALGKIGDARAAEPLIKIFIKLNSDDSSFFGWKEEHYKAIANSLKGIPGVEAEFERLEAYDKAEEWYTFHGRLEEAAAIRRKKAEMTASRTEIHGDYVDDRDTTYIDDRDTIIKDSVISKSNVGAGGDDKLAKIKELKELLDSGAIDKDDYEKMKREIIG